MGIPVNRGLTAVRARLPLSLWKRTKALPDFAPAFRMVGKEKTGPMPRPLEPGERVARVSTEVRAELLMVSFPPTQVLMTFRLAAVEAEEADQVAPAASPLVAVRAAGVDPAPPARVLFLRGTAAAAAGQEKEAEEVRAAMADRGQQAAGAAQST